MDNNFFKKSSFWLMCIFILLLIEFLGVLCFYLSSLFVGLKSIFSLELWSVLGNIATVITVIITVCIFISERNKKRKEDTIYAFSKVRTTLIRTRYSIWKMNENQEFLLNCSKPLNKKVLLAVIEQIALLEHFSVGVNIKIYDIKTVKAMAGNRLIAIWYNVKPIIENRRYEFDDYNSYTQFEAMIKNLEKLKQLERNGEK